MRSQVWQTFFKILKSISKSPKSPKLAQITKILKKILKTSPHPGRAPSRSAAWKNVGKEGSPWKSPLAATFAPRTKRRSARRKIGTSRSHRGAWAAGAPLVWARRRRVGLRGWPASRRPACAGSNPALKRPTAACFVDKNLNWKIWKNY